LGLQGFAILDDCSSIPPAGVLSTAAQSRPFMLLQGFAILDADGGTGWDLLCNLIR